MEDTFSGIRLSGKTVYHGITIGKVMVLRNDKDQIRRRKIADPAREIERVRMAVDVSKQQLAAIYHQAVKKLGESSAAIFEVHQMMLEDKDFLNAIDHMIRTELVSAEYAVAVTGDNFEEIFTRWRMHTCRRAQQMSGIFQRVWCGICQGRGIRSFV